MATTPGYRNMEDDALARIRFFCMHSWTLDEYLAAIADQVFYNKIKPKLDATSHPEGNDDDDQDQDHEEGGWSDQDNKYHAFALKIFYAGGSCRFMFQYPTVKGVKALKYGVVSTWNKTDLVHFCYGAVFSYEINKLYGMYRDDSSNRRFPVSSYATSLFVEDCKEEAIENLAGQLEASDSALVSGHLLEWLLLASVPKRAVRLYSADGVVDVLPQARVLRYDQKKQFKTRPDQTIQRDLC